VDLIAPIEAYDLVSKLKEETDFLVELHHHCISYMIPISYYATCQAIGDILYIRYRNFNFI